MGGNIRPQIDRERVWITCPGGIPCNMSPQLRSAVLTLAGFVCGLLIMYVALLDRIRPMGAMSPLTTALQNLANSKGVEVLSLKQRLLVAHMPPASGGQLIPCNRTSETPCLMNTTESGSSLGILSWDEVQEQRRHQVTQTCSGFSYLPKMTSSLLWDIMQDNDNILIDRSHKVIFCAIPKAACSSWKSALALLSTQVSLNQPGALRGIHFNGFMKSIGISSPSDLTESHLYDAANEYTKVLVVRHPFERLVSAYRDKFGSHNKYSRHFQHRYGRTIVMLYRGHNVLKRSLRKGNDVTFEEFLTYIVDDTIPITERMNPHWDTYQHLCHPCAINYDHVIKFDTLEEDNSVVLKRYFSVKNHTQIFPRRNVNDIPSKDVMVQYYSRVPDSLIHRIYNFYRDDMKLFGYELPPELLTDKMPAK